MPDELWEAIKEDAEAQNKMAAEHVREICRQYLKEETDDIRERLDAVEARLGDLRDVEQRLDRQQELLEEQAQRIEQLEQQLQQGIEADTTETGGATGDESTAVTRSTGDTTSTAVEEPDVVETIDDAVQVARARFAEEHDPQRAERMAEAGRAALEALQERGEMFAKDFREDLASEYPIEGQSEGEWWRETVEPVLEIAEDWGLVFNAHGHEYEWIGPAA